ncbi:hypothetical protein LCGC14_2499180, partial [marine sediment metagenome]
MKEATLITLVVILGVLVFIAFHLDQLAIPEKPSITALVIVTAYSPSKRQTDDSPLITASNQAVRGDGVAVSRDLFLKGWTFGKKVWIQGIGLYTINDLMHPSKRNHL